MELPSAATEEENRQRRSVACQTDSQELDEATLRNELAMKAYLEILGVLDDDRQPVYHDLGEAYANKVFLQTIAMEEAGETDDAASSTAVAVEIAGGPEDPQDGGSGVGAQFQRLRSLETEVIEAEWSLRGKLAQVREEAKHPVQRWLEGAMPQTASASPFASRAPSVRHLTPHQRHLSATASHCSRPSSVAALSEVFVSDSDDEEDNEDEDPAAAGAAAADHTPVGNNKSEMTFYSCSVHGMDVPESFVRIKVRGGGGGGNSGKSGGGSDSAGQQE